MDIDDALDTIYGVIDDALRAGRFHVADQILAAVDIRAPPVLLVGYLSISFAARDLLPSRSWLAERVRTRLLHERGADKCAAILRGLVP
jgi:hypothetical protein